MQKLYVGFLLSDHKLILLYFSFDILEFGVILLQDNWVILDFIDYIIGDLRQNFNKQNKIMSFKTLSYDESSRRIFNDTISLILTEKENEIFYFLLVSESGVSKNVLLKNIWKYNESIDTHTLETHIYSLRKKLEKKLEIKDILEHKESGYSLNKDLL